MTKTRPSEATMSSPIDYFPWPVNQVINTNSERY